MNNVLLYCGCLALLLTSACAKSTPEEPKPPKTIELRYNASIKEGDTLMQFAAVTSDSRCPTGTQCSWPGNAEIVLELNGDGYQAAILNTNAQYPQSSRYNNQTITLKELRPYPEAGQTIDANAYTAVLLIE